MRDNRKKGDEKMIKYAVDDKGNLWCADNPNQPDRLGCALCGVSMYKKVSPLGNSFYAVFSGVCHSHEACRALDGSVDILDITKTNVDSFWNRVLRKRSQPKIELDGDGGPGGTEELGTVDATGEFVGSAVSEEPGNQTGGSGDTNTLEESVGIDVSNRPADAELDEGHVTVDALAGLGGIGGLGRLAGANAPEHLDDFGSLKWEFGSFKKTTREVQERIRGMYTLPHLAATGFLDCDNFQLGDGVWLSDITINPRFAYMLLGMEKVGNRILQGRPQRYFNWSQTIRLKAFIAQNIVGQKIRCYKILDLHFPEESLYEKTRNMLFEHFYVAEMGAIKVRMRYDRVAIAGCWRSKPVGQCSCDWECASAGWTCQGQLCVDVFRSGYIFPLPSKEKTSGEAEEKTG